MITTLKFLAESPRFEYEKPYEMFGYPQIPAEQRSNCTYVTFKDIQLSDVRGSDNDFSLEECGFQFIKHESRCRLSSKHFEMPGDDPSPVVGDYLEETMDKVREHLKASKVVCFDWRVSGLQVLSDIYLIMSTVPPERLFLRRKSSADRCS